MRLAVQIFTKPAVPGWVKTRLAATVGEERAAQVHRELAEIAFGAVAQFEEQHAEVQTTLWLAREPIDAWLGSVAAARGWRWESQQGPDLGARMAHAVAAGLDAGNDATIIIGTDCPVMSATVLAGARTALLAGAAHVIAPAEDGGYALIACRTPAPIFREIKWSTDKVLHSTLQRIRDLSVGAVSGTARRSSRVALLPTMWDVDEQADLARWQALAAGRDVSLGRPQR